jgi:ribonuclease R
MGRRRKSTAPPAAEPLDRKLLHLLHRRGRKGVRLGSLARAARLNPSEAADLAARLEELQVQGVIARSRDGHSIVLASAARLVTGTLRLHPDGYGFLVTGTPGEEDYYVPRTGVRPALDGDRVQARVERRRQSVAARVVAVLERGRTDIVGVYRREGILESREQNLPYRVRIPKGRSSGAADGDLVVATIVTYPNRHDDIEAEITAVLGQPGDHRTETEAIIRRHCLPTHFPPAVLAEAAGIEQRVRPSDVQERLDLRDIPLLTIDGENARDFDDAVALELRPPVTRLWVAIADVSHYVLPGSAIDQEAAERGTSVYFPDRVLPMLPEALSNELCSLKPGTDRLAMAAALDFDAQGHLEDTEFHRCVIRSVARLTYTEVKALLVDGNEAVQKRYSTLAPMLMQMERLCRMLMAHRRARGSIDFDLPEAEVVLDLTGRTENIVKAERHIGHQIIEEFMIAANSAVARRLLSSRHPCLHRVHEAPDAEKTTELSRFLSGLGLPPLPPEPAPADFQRIVSAAAGRPEERLVNTVLLRSMKQARYATEPLGHFGLATGSYTHFTSPIRRYPDLVVHRTLKEVLAHTKLSAEGRTRRSLALEAIAENSSSRERVAMEAERECIALKKVELMQDKVGQEFGAYISGVQRYGIFVELEDFFVEGLVPIATLGDDHYEHVERAHSLRGRRTGRRYRLGDPVRVRLVGADPTRRRLDFVLVETGEGAEVVASPAAPPTRRRGSRPRKTSRRRP